MPGELLTQLAVNMPVSAWRACRQRTLFGMWVRREQCGAAAIADGRAGARGFVAAARRGGPPAVPRYRVMARVMAGRS